MNINSLKDKLVEIVQCFFDKNPSNNDIQVNYISQIKNCCDTDGLSQIIQKIFDDKIFQNAQNKLQMKEMSELFIYSIKYKEMMGADYRIDGNDMQSFIAKNIDNNEILTEAEKKLKTEYGKVGMMLYEFENRYHSQQFTECLKLFFIKNVGNTYVLSRIEEDIDNRMDTVHKLLECKQNHNIDIKSFIINNIGDINELYKLSYDLTDETESSFNPLVACKKVKRGMLNIGHGIPPRSCEAVLSLCNNVEEYPYCKKVIYSISDPIKKQRYKDYIRNSITIVRFSHLEKPQYRQEFIKEYLLNHKEFSIPCHTDKHEFLLRFRYENNHYIVDFINRGKRGNYPTICSFDPNISTDQKDIDIIANRIVNINDNISQIMDRTIINGKSIKELYNNEEKVPEIMLPSGETYKVNNVFYYTVYNGIRELVQHHERDITTISNTIIKDITQANVLNDPVIKTIPNEIAFVNSLKDQYKNGTCVWIAYMYSMFMPLEMNSIDKKVSFTTKDKIDTIYYLDNELKKINIDINDTELLIKYFVRKMAVMVSDDRNTIGDLISKIIPKDLRQELIKSTYDIAKKYRNEIDQGCLRHKDEFLNHTTEYKNSTGIISHRFFNFASDEHERARNVEELFGRFSNEIKDLSNRINGLETKQQGLQKYIMYAFISLTNHRDIEIASRFQKYAEQYKVGHNNKELKICKKNMQLFVSENIGNPDKLEIIRQILILSDEYKEKTGVDYRVYKQDMQSFISKNIEDITLLKDVQNKLKEEINIITLDFNSIDIKNKKMSQFIEDNIGKPNELKKLSNITQKLSELYTTDKNNALDPFAIHDNKEFISKIVCDNIKDTEGLKRLEAINKLITFAEVYKNIIGTEYTIDKQDLKSFISSNNTNSKILDTVVALLNNTLGIVTGLLALQKAKYGEETINEIKLFIIDNIGNFKTLEQRMIELGNKPDLSQIKDQKGKSIKAKKEQKQEDENEFEIVVIEEQKQNAVATITGEPNTREQIGQTTGKVLLTNILSISGGSPHVEQDKAKQDQKQREGIKVTN